jgi:hypothetical protein
MSTRLTRVLTISLLVVWCLLAVYVYIFLKPDTSDFLSKIKVYDKEIGKLVGVEEFEPQIIRLLDSCCRLHSSVSTDLDNCQISKGDMKRYMNSTGFSNLCLHNLKVYPIPSELNDNPFCNVTSLTLDVTISKASLMKMVSDDGQKHVAQDILDYLLSKKYDYNFSNLSIESSVKFYVHLVLWAALILIILFIVIIYNSQNQATNNQQNDTDIFSIKLTLEKANQLQLSGYIMLLMGAVIVLSIVVLINSTFKEVSNSDKISITDSIKVFFANNSRNILFTLLLSTISFFFLKQYRKLLDDYKEFYFLYLRRSDLFQASNALKRNDLKNTELIIASMIIEQHKSEKFSHNKKEDDISHPLVDVLNNIINKLLKKE